MSLRERVKEGVPQVQNIKYMKHKNTSQLILGNAIKALKTKKIETTACMKFMKYF